MSNAGSIAAQLELAMSLQQRGDLRGALAIYQQVMAVDPDNVLALNTLGMLYGHMGMMHDALACFTRASIINPNDFAFHFNRGKALKELGQHVEALNCYDRTLELNPLFPEAHNNRGNVLNDLKRYDEALVNFDRAIALNPNYAQANVNMGLLLLLLGNYADGWPLYEWRWKITPYKYASRSFSQPLWLGETSIAGKTILLYSEQGFGDAIQFVRYVPMVTSLGADVILEIQADLVPLVGHLSSSSRIIAKGDQLPEFNFHCPLMSLPLALGTTSTEKIPSSVPYLTLASSIRNKWHDRLGKRVRPRVGLVWSGNPCHQNDRNRSIRLRIFEPLLSMDLDFHVLQKEIRDDDRVTVLEFNNIQLHENEISDFSDTAALISELDLVISVDTSVAHLAGALGKEVWILLPFSPDYRWMLHRTDTPWYPTARFFRQSEIGNWQSVIADVVTEISIRTGENVSDES